VPSISRWQWHPFSVTNAVGYSLTLNIKRYGAFTEALMDTLQSGDACRQTSESELAHAVILITTMPG